MYWRDYVADTGHLSTEEHGAYLLLIAHYWLSGKPLPKDDAALARLARATAARWRAIRSAVMAFFRLTDDGWRHKRIDQELAKAEQVSSARRASGRIGGQQSASKRQANAPPNAQARGQQEVQQTGQQNPTPSLTPKEPTTTLSSLPSARPPIARGFSEADLCDVLRETVEAAGFSAIEIPRKLEQIWQWYEAGCHPELDVLETIKRLMRQRNGTAPGTLKYFTDAIHRARDERLKRESEAA